MTPITKTYTNLPATCCVPGAACFVFKEPSTEHEERRTAVSAFGVRVFVTDRCDLRAARFFPCESAISGKRNDPAHKSWSYLRPGGRRFDDRRSFDASPE